MTLYTQCTGTLIILFAENLHNVRFKCDVHALLRQRYRTAHRDHNTAAISYTVFVTIDTSRIIKFAFNNYIICPVVLHYFLFRALFSVHCPARNPNKYTPRRIMTSVRLRVFKQKQINNDCIVTLVCCK